MNTNFGLRVWVLFVILLICGLYPISVMAQDPGLPDSAIIDGDTLLAYNPGAWSTYNAYVYCVTDDSIMFINLSLEWSGNTGDIFPSHVGWHNMFDIWEHNVNFQRVSLNRISLNAGVEWGQSGPPLYTNYQRQLQATISILVSPHALPQTVEINSCRDSVNGITEFANIDITFIPKFKKLRFRYGEPGLAVDEKNAFPIQSALKACYPNPSNSSTMIEIELQKAADCKLIIYDILGREIACLIDGELGSGRHSIVWNGMANNGEEAVSGVYFVNIATNGVTETRKIELIR